MVNSRLRKGLEELGLTLCDNQVALLMAYLELMQRWNTVYNLTALTELDGMIDLHLLDSLTLIPFLKGESLLDVGTGAGLPGMVLAIARPALKVTLLDSNGKKMRFVTQAVIELGLDNVKPVQSRIESYNPEPSMAGFDNIVCRAFTDLEHFRQLASPLLSTDGQLLAMKGKEKDLYRRVSEAVKANTQATSWQVHPVQLPGVDKERHICIHTALRSHSGEG